MRPGSAYGEERAFVGVFLRGLCRVLRVLLDQHRVHFEMGELLGADILQHVADAGVGGVKRLRPICQGRCEFARRAAELLEQLLREHRVRVLNVRLRLQDGSA